jgi:hypothetical protein
VLYVLLVPSYYDEFKGHVSNLSIYLHLSNYKIETPSISNTQLLYQAIHKSLAEEHVAKHHFLLHIAHPKYKFCCTSQRRPPQCFVSPCGCLIRKRLCEWMIADCLSRQPRPEKRGNGWTHSPDHEIFKRVIGFLLRPHLENSFTMYHTLCASDLILKVSSVLQYGTSHYVSSTRGKGNDSTDYLGSLRTTSLGMHA